VIWTSSDTVRWEKFNSAEQLWGVKFGRDSFFAIGNGGYILQSAPVQDPASAVFRPGAVRFEANGAVRLALDTPPGETIVLEESSNLSTWAPLASRTDATALSEFTEPDARRFDRRFFRARVLSQREQGGLVEGAVLRTRDR
jgi:hypothetical protein